MPAFAINSTQWHVLGLLGFERSGVMKKVRKSFHHVAPQLNDAQMAEKLAFICEVSTFTKEDLALLFGENPNEALEKIRDIIKSGLDDEYRERLTEHRREQSAHKRKLEAMYGSSLVKEKMKKWNSENSRPTKSSIRDDEFSRWIFGGALDEDDDDAEGDDE